MNDIAGPWISGLTAARCGECAGVFDSSKGGCPKGDSGESGWVPLSSTRGRDEIRRLRDQIDMARAALLQIAHGLHEQRFKARIALRALAYLAGSQTETAPASPSAASRKETVQ